MKAILILHLFIFNNATGEVTVNKVKMALPDAEVCFRVAEATAAELKVAGHNFEIKCEDVK